MTRTQALRTGVVWLSFAALALQIALVAYRWDFYQYDFRAYYSGPHLFLTGQDPYSVEAHLAWAEGEGLHNHSLRFIYSPVLLRLFLPLAYVSYPVAYGIWLTLQMAALAAVFLLGLRALRVPAHWLAPCLAFGLNGTCAAVIRSGQVELMILAGLLACVLLLQRGRTGAGLAAFFAAAALKIWVLPMVAIAALPLGWTRVLKVAACVALIVAFATSGKVFDPELQARHEAVIAGLVSFDAPPASPYDQSLRNILSYFGEAGLIAPGYRIVVGAIIAALVAGSSAVVAIRLSLAGLEARELYAFLYVLGILGLLLIVPRAIHYQWTSALPAVAFCLARLRPGIVQTGLAVLVMVPSFYISRYAFGISTDSRLEGLLVLPWGFWSYMVCVFAWGVAMKLALDRMRPFGRSPRALHEGVDLS